jgi:putative PIN family toxin of toxin-antitoxin system
VIRAILDANVFASGVLRIDEAASTPGAILRLWQLGRAFELVTSDPLIAEIEHTVAKPYFAARIRRRASDLLVAALREQATRTEITVTVTGVATHPEDDLVLAAAVSAEADFLVTGDKQLQHLGGYRGVLIVSPREFLFILEQE